MIDTYRRNPLSMAVRAPKNLEKLLKYCKGKQMEALINDSESVPYQNPLCCAIHERMVPSIKLLLQYGAKVDSVFVPYSDALVPGSSASSPLAALFKEFPKIEITADHLQYLRAATRELLWWGAKPQERVIKTSGNLILPPGPNAYDYYLQMATCAKKIVGEEVRNIELVHHLKTINRKEPTSYLSYLPQEIYFELYTFATHRAPQEIPPVALPIEQYQHILQFKEKEEPAH